MRLILALLLLPAVARADVYALNEAAITATPVAAPVVPPVLTPSSLTACTAAGAAQALDDCVTGRKSAPNDLWIVLGTVGGSVLSTVLVGLAAYYLPATPLGR